MADLPKVILGSFGYMLYASTHVYLTEQSGAASFLRLEIPLAFADNSMHFAENTTGL